VNKEGPLQVCQGTKTSKTLGALQSNFFYSVRRETEGNMGTTYTNLHTTEEAESATSMKYKQRKNSRTKEKKYPEMHSSLRAFSRRKRKKI